MWLPALLSSLQTEATGVTGGVFRKTPQGVTADHEHQHTVGKGDILLVRGRALKGICAETKLLRALPRYLLRRSAAARGRARAGARLQCQGRSDKKGPEPDRVSKTTIMGRQSFPTTVVMLRLSMASGSTALKRWPTEAALLTRPTNLAPTAVSVMPDGSVAPGLHHDTLLSVGFVDVGFATATGNLPCRLLRNSGHSILVACMTCRSTELPTSWCCTTAAIWSRMPSSWE